MLLLLRLFALLLLCLHRSSPFNANRNLETAYFQIKQVTSAEQCADVLIFRRMSMIFDKQKTTGTHSSFHKEMALQMRQDLLVAWPRSIQSFEAGGGKTVQFVATANSTRTTTTIPKCCSNGTTSEMLTIVGAVDVTVEPGVRSRTFELPDRVHVKNLRVHKDYRRKGIGRAMLSAIELYATGSFSTKNRPTAISLKVEAWNNPKAVKLYEQAGFTFREQVYPGFMIKWLL